MIIESKEFFNNLPPKVCEGCNKLLMEQHESYTNTCNDCSDFHLLKSN